MTITELIISYVFYGSIIVIGLVILGIIRTVTKAPSNSDIRQKLMVIKGKIESVSEQIDEKSNEYYKMFRQVTNIVYLIDHAVIYVTEAGERERDTTFDQIRIKLEAARDIVSPYKFEKKSNYRPEDFREAAACLEDSIFMTDGIIERGKRVKGR